MISEGYDGTVDGDFGYEDELTNSERLEVADYMIRLWQRYRDDHEAN